MVARPFIHVARLSELGLSLHTPVLLPEGVHCGFSAARWCHMHRLSFRSGGSATPRAAQANQDSVAAVQFAFALL